MTKEEIISAQKEIDNSIIERMKHSIIDTSLILGTSIGMVMYILSLMRYAETGFIFIYVSDFIVLSLLGTLVLLRKKISLRWKALAIILIIFTVIMTDVYKWGLMSSNKEVMVLIPFFSILAYNLRTTLFIFGMAILTFSFFGYLHIEGLIQAEFLDDYFTGADIWAINVIMLLLVGILIFLVTFKFNESYQVLVEKLEYRVQERTKALSDSNEKLVRKNLELEEQQQRLHDAMNTLKQTQTRLIESEKMASIGVLAAGVAHEINNPLNFIQGGSYGIQAYFDDSDVKVPEDVSRSVEAIQTGVDRAAQIVSSLNQFSRKGQSTDRSDVIASLRNCLVILNHEIKGRIEVHEDFDSEEQYAQAAEGKLHQVFLNLLNNAVQAIQGKGKIEISVTQESNHVIVRITDDGEGMPKAIIERVTEPFFTTKVTGKGTGLGLAITSNILDELSGTISFTSELGQGTTVEVRLPV